MPNSLQPQGIQHSRLPCPSPTPKACSNSCPLSWWCHPTISSSVIPFSSCLWSFPASRSFPMSQLFADSGGQSIRASASALPLNSQGWFSLGLTGLILQSRGLSRVFFFFWGSITLAKTLCLHESCFEIQIPLRRSYRVCEEFVRNGDQYTRKEKLVEVSWRKRGKGLLSF